MGDGSDGNPSRLDGSDLSKSQRLLKFSLLPSLPSNVLGLRSLPSNLLGLPSLPSNLLGLPC